MPSGDLDDPFAIKVILGHAGRTATGCKAEESGAAALPGCIFARRALHYVSHTELTLPIALRADCDGVVCRDQATTCVHGSCVRAVIPDPGICHGNACDDGVLPPPDGGVVVSDGGPGDGDARDVDSQSPPSDACAGGACPFLRQNSQAFPATVSAFRLDKYETTVGRFRAFVDASPWVPAAGSGKHTHLPRGLYSVKELAYEQGWAPAWGAKLPKTKDDWNTRLLCMGASWTPSVSGNEDLPIVCVSWYDAYAFCIWDGGFLPSYAEWNFAAVGGREQRTYPWGAGPVDLNHSQFCSNMLCALIHVGFKVPGNGRYGQSDLAGNVWEWVLDSFPPTTGDVCNDCVVFDASTTQRTALGGGFHSAPPTLAGDFLSADPSDYFDLSNGFRCARPP